MTRFENKLLPLCEGANVKIENNVIEITGPKGTLQLKFPDGVEVIKQEKGIIVKSNKTKSKKHIISAFVGMVYKRVSNLMIGVTEGFSKELELNGIGYRWSFSGGVLSMSLGFSHPVEYKVPDGIAVDIKQNKLTLSGIDKYLVGQVSAIIKNYRPVEPYKGKGIFYTDEYIIRKQGKKGS